MAITTNRGKGSDILSSVSRKVRTGEWLCIYFKIIDKLEHMYRVCVRVEILLHLEAKICGTLC